MGMVTGTSFENEVAQGVFYSDPQTNGTALPDNLLVDVVNQSGEPIVDSTISSTNAGDLGFNLVWINTVRDVGFSDGDRIGVTDFVGDVGSFTDGTQGYRFNDADGEMRLIFDEVDAGAPSIFTITFDYFVRNNAYEGNDLFEAWVLDENDVRTDVLSLDAAGLEAAEGGWLQATAVVNNVDAVQLVMSSNFDQGGEILYVDNVMIDAVPGGSVSLFDNTATLVGAFTTIQDAVAAITTNDSSIIIDDGIYREQVVVNSAIADGLTIEAANPGNVTIEAPDAVDLLSTTANVFSGDDIFGVFTVDGVSDVEIISIDVDGRGQGSAVPGEFVGLAATDADGLIVDDVHVTGVRDALDGNGFVTGDQQGTGIYAAFTAFDPLINLVDIVDSSVEDFQKTGIYVENANVLIDDVTVTGGGLQPNIAQNGIQLVESTGIVADNTIEEIGFTSGNGLEPTTVAAGILAFGGELLAIEGNTISIAMTPSGFAGTEDQPLGGFGGITAFGLSNLFLGIDVSNNTILGSDGLNQFGIDISDAEDVTIVGNAIDDIFATLAISAFPALEGGFEELNGPITVAGNVLTNSDAGLFFDPEPVDAFGESFILSGTALPDDIFGGEGDDVFSGEDADDILAGRAGNDTLEGERGNDTLDGGGGVDTAVFSGDRDDYDIVDNNDGTFVITDIRLNATDGVDFLIDVEFAEFADETVELVEGVDPGKIVGGDNDDTLLGTEDADEIHGNGGNDLIIALGDDDTIDGGKGRDTLRGQDGDDSIDGGDNSDSITGGEGNDTLRGNNGRDVIRGDGGDDDIDGGEDDDNLEGLGGNDLISDSLGSNRMKGGAGNDTLIGGDEIDTLRGGRDDDSMIGNGGNDIMSDDIDGDDFFDGGDGDDNMVDVMGNDTMLGGAGNDRMDAGMGDDSIVGGDGNDSLIGKAGNDTLIGGDGDDRANGGIGNDFIDTGAGNELIRAGGGEDTIIGGTGDDTIQSDGDDDLIVFRFGDGNDTILDFNRFGNDTIEVSGFGPAFDTEQEVLDAAVQQGSSVFIDFGGGDSLTLNGLQLADLDTADFAIALVI